ncbi:hypothetical protein AB6M97_07700 [Streptococcus hillyeri]|uniref:HNH domain-containing protein n=1 Tax=Streptococcus hillyeri TaxID=2282420 RepID=A0A3L9DMR5_9STRE|nr:hypothetical protein [Streptococcus hillyeri]RLY01203.1 hypothetical protein EAF07_10085 [Streptococcus hillyeri]
MIYFDRHVYSDSVKELYYNKAKTQYIKLDGNIVDLMRRIKDIIGKDSFSNFFQSVNSEDNFKQLILMPANDIKSIAEIIKKRVGNKEISTKKMEYRNIQRLKSVYTTGNIMQKSNKGQKLNILLTNALGVTVCPYCNRNFINNRDDKLGSQMDHFYSKDTYPMFAISLYNFVPCCSICNLNKGNKEFWINPWIQENVDENEVKFDYLLKSLTDMEITIDGGSKRLADTEIIKLNAGYQIHQIDIKDMLDREVKYSYTYRKELQEIFKNAVNKRDETAYENFNQMLADDEIDYLIHGNAVFTEDIKNIPLGKFKKDIFSEIRKMRDC